MKTIRAALAVIALTFAASPALANIKCGIKPIPPIGCDRDDAVCVCDSNGNCQWVFQCN
jgi:hypothetical protein